MSGASISDDPQAQSSPEAPSPAPVLIPTAPVELDDLLDPAVLDGSDQEEEEEAALLESRKHLQNLHRWDRVPMGMFRRSRTATARIAARVAFAQDDAGSSAQQQGNQHPLHRPVSLIANTASTSRVSDGFSYGGTPSSGGLALRSPAHAHSLGSMLWDSDVVGGNAGAGRRRRGRSRRCKKVDISPVIFPVADLPPAAHPQKTRSTANANASKESTPSNSNSGPSRSSSTSIVGGERKGRGAGVVSSVVPPLNLSQ